MMLRAFFRRDLAYQMSYRLDFVWHVGSLLFFGLLLFFLASALPGFTAGHRVDGYFAFAIVGYTMADSMWACLKSFSGAIRRDQVVGTLEAMMSTATPLWILVIGAGGYPVLYALVRMALMLGMAAVMGAGFTWTQVLTAIPVMALSMSVFACLGVFSASMILIVKQGDPVAAVIGALSFLFSGTLYPVEALPDTLEWVARLLPLTYCIDAVRGILLDSATLSDVSGDIVALGGSLVLCGVLAAASIRIADRVVRVNGIRQY
jgi:ABC-2 type transport system permease protein